MSPPKVTVLVPVFNRAQFVDETIRSVIAQDFDDFELLLVDDGSTDATPAILDAWQKRDPRVVVITSPTNQGIPTALNLGLAHARGAYVARLDSDDLMMSHRLAAQAAVLDARPDVALVSSAYDIVDREGRHLRTWKSDGPHEVIAFLLHFFNSIGGGGQVMFRRMTVLEEGGYALDYPSREDYDLWVRLLRRGRIETLPLIGMTKRTHAEQSKARWGGERRAHWTAIMRSSLEPYLGRNVRDDEIAALITVWRLDGAVGAGKRADDVMREALVRFDNEVHDPALRARVRHAIARQWYRGARNLARRGRLLEALRYLARAARWRITPRANATA